VRTFQTCYDADGLVTEWGESDMNTLFQNCYAADRLQGRIDATKGHSTKKHRRRLAWYRLLQGIRDKISEVHKKLATWLCENYRVILLPKFETQQMVRRRNRKLATKTARGMCTWAHFRFRQMLLSKAELYPWCQVIICDEHYTSKTCGRCGTLNQTLGAKKTFNCGACGYEADRDISAARNILLRYLTRSEIGHPI
jgi:putative transposase